jgi:hypothetical protein
MFMPKGMRRGKEKIKSNQSFPDHRGWPGLKPSRPAAFEQLGAAKTWFFSS